MCNINKCFVFVNIAVIFRNYNQRRQENEKQKKYQAYSICAFIAYT